MSSLIVNSQGRIQSTAQIEQRLSLLDIAKVLGTLESHGERELLGELAVDRLGVKQTAEVLLGQLFSAGSLGGFRLHELTGFVLLEGAVAVCVELGEKLVVVLLVLRNCHRCVGHLLNLK